MATESLVLGEPYCDDDWPHGLRCGQCRHLFQEPERYIARPDAFLDDTLLTTICCLACFGLTSEPLSALPA